MAQIETLDQHVDRRLVSRAMKAPFLTQDAEYELIDAWRDRRDERALSKLVDAYLRLVIAQAGKFRQFGLPPSDLVQEGTLGLIQAADRFDTARGVRFATYATWWVRAAMQDYVLRNWSIVRIGSSATQKALFFKLRWLRARIESGRDVRPDQVRSEIATALKVSPRDVDDMANRLSGRDHSLDAPVGEDGEGAAGDFLPDPGPTPEEITQNRLDGAVRSRWLQAALKELTPREKLIVERRQLSEDVETLEEIGSQLGVTKERVRQIEHKALGKLRDSVLRHARESGAAFG
jgi:RNA polymerase sigma-32 factor